MSKIRHTRISYKAAWLLLGGGVVRWSICRRCPRRGAGRRFLPQRAETSPHRQPATRQRRRGRRRTFRRGSDGRRQSGRRQAMRVSPTVGVVVALRRREVRHWTVEVCSLTRHSTGITSHRFVRVAVQRSLANFKQLDTTWNDLTASISLRARRESG